MNNGIFEVLLRTMLRALSVVSSREAAKQPSSVDPPSHIPANAAMLLENSNIYLCFKRKSILKKHFWNLDKYNKAHISSLGGTCFSGETCFVFFKTY